MAADPTFIVQGTQAAGRSPVATGATGDPTWTDIATQTELDAHTGASTSVHGITDTSALVVTTDARLSDHRYSKILPRINTYIGADFGVINTLATTLNRAYWTPFISDGLRTYDRIGVWSQAGAVSSVTRLGRFQDNGSIYPGTLISDDGTVDTSVSSSQQDITINWTPAAGIYWLCAVPQNSGTPTLGAGQNLQNFFRVTGASGTGGFFLAGVTGALSSNPVGLSNDISQCVRVVLRIAA